MSTHNICFRGELRKILCGYPLLSVAMTSDSPSNQSYSAHALPFSKATRLDFWLKLPLGLQLMRANRINSGDTVQMCRFCQNLCCSPRLELFFICDVAHTLFHKACFNLRIS